MSPSFSLWPIAPYGLALIPNFSVGETSEDASTMANTEEEKTENVTDQQECTSTEMIK